VRTSESFQEEDAGAWGKWSIGGLKTTPQLAPGEHRTVGGPREYSEMALGCQEGYPSLPPSLPPSLLAMDNGFRATTAASTPISTECRATCIDAAENQA
jgi:hypothetical protein